VEELKETNESLMALRSNPAYGEVYLMPHYKVYQ